MSTRSAQERRDPAGEGESSESRSCRAPVVLTYQSDGLVIPRSPFSITSKINLQVSITRAGLGDRRIAPPALPPSTATTASGCLAALASFAGRNRARSDRSMLPVRPSGGIDAVTAAIAASLQEWRGSTPSIERQRVERS